jgi:hypothetical protein
MPWNHQAVMTETAANAGNDFSSRGPAGEDAGPAVPENGEKGNILSVPENDKYSLLTAHEILEVFQAGRFDLPASVQQAKHE